MNCAVVHDEQHVASANNFFLNILKLFYCVCLLGKSTRYLQIFIEVEMSTMKVLACGSIENIYTGNL